MQGISQGNGAEKEDRNILLDNKDNCKLFGFVSICKVPREQVEVAHNLAKTTLKEWIYK